MIAKLTQRALMAALVAVPLNVGAFAGAAYADDTVVCESRDNRHQVCFIPGGKHGYVRLGRQLGRHPCIQGRTWDYDKRSIWVDDNCKGQFIVEDRDGGGGNKAAAAAVLGAVAIAAVVAANKKKENDHYADDNYYGGGHNSYVQPWMVGSFSGYNTQFNAPVDLTIENDGRATARLGGTSVKGYVNAGRLYLGDHEFILSRVGGGLSTSQVGDPDNNVVYRRR